MEPTIKEFLDENMKSAIRQYLEAQDNNHNGLIDVNELENILWGLGLAPTNDDVVFLKQHLDKNGDGKLEVEEIMANLELLLQQTLDDKSLLKAFQIFDRDKDGYISTSELLVILLQNGFMPLAEAKEFLREVITQYDADGDGRFNYTEFAKLYTHTCLRTTIQAKVQSHLEKVVKKYTR